MVHYGAIARRQTLVQLNDELLALLDERAARTRSSRSQLIRDALEQYLAAEREAAIDRAIVEGYTRIPQDEHDPWAEAAAIESIRAEPW
jgi:metal-responsive CopG/Arc/MetJ family transcriptional regulator